MSLTLSLLFFSLSIYTSFSLVISVFIFVYKFVNLSKSLNNCLSFYFSFFTLICLQCYEYFYLWVCLRRYFSSGVYFKQPFVNHPLFLDQFLCLFHSHLQLFSINLVSLVRRLLFWPPSMVYIQSSLHKYYTLQNLSPYKSVPGHWWRGRNLTLTMSWVHVTYQWAYTQHGHLRSNPQET